MESGFSTKPNHSLLTLGLVTDSLVLKDQKKESTPGESKNNASDNHLECIEVNDNN